MASTLRLVVSLLDLQEKKTRSLFWLTISCCGLLGFLQFESIYFASNIGSLLDKTSPTTFSSEKLFGAILRFIVVALSVSLSQSIVYILSSRWAIALSKTASETLVNGYIYGKYSDISRLSISKEISLCVTQLNQVVTGIIFKFFPTLSAAFSLVAVLLGLIYSFGQNSLFVLLVAGSPGILYSTIIKARLKSISNLYFQRSSDELYLAKAILESKGEIEILNVHSDFSTSYSSVICDIRKSQGAERLYDQSQKPLTEVLLLLIAFIILAMSYFWYGSESIGSIISQSLVYLVAFSKLLPASNLVSKTFNSLRVCHVPLSHFIMRVESLEAHSRTGNSLNSSASNKTIEPFLHATKPQQSCKVISININKSEYYLGSRVYQVSDVLFSCNHGFYCVIGESGAGKSSFLNMMCSLINAKYFSAEVVLRNLNGEKVVECIDSSSMIKDFSGYSFQNPYIFKGKSLLYNITMKEDICSVDRTLLGDCLRLSSSSDFAPSLDYLSNNVLGDSGINLSGGQLKRLGLARAIYFSKGIILIDECTSGLDAKNEENLIQSLTLLSQKYIVIAASHSAAVIEAAGSILRIKKTGSDLYVVE